MFAREKVVQQLIYILVIVAGVLLIILTLPINTDDKNLILSLFGIVVGAIITFSSTTFVANAMAGVMLRLIVPFRVGDYIKIDGTFGRVTEMYFLHTQVQSIDRDLITIPNIKLVSSPLKTIRSSGTIITTTVSLGYEIPRKDIEQKLLEAAELTGLENSFVHVEELGDFSITYKVGGLLKDVESLITARSDFRKNVMDSLHGADIEIVSPTYMNQRVFSTEHVCLPPKKEKGSKTVTQPEVKAEEIIFDKAITARTLDRIYINNAGLDERRKNMEEKIKMLEEIQAQEKLREELSDLALMSEELKPRVEELKDLPDITLIEEEDKDINIEIILGVEKEIEKLSELHSNLEKKLDELTEKLHDPDKE